MSDPTYQAVLFNVDKLDKPKIIILRSLTYDALKTRWTKEVKLGETTYSVLSVRSFDVVSEIFGTTYYLIIDLKKT